MKMFTKLLCAVLVLLALSPFIIGQSIQPTNNVKIQMVSAYYPQIPISSTAGSAAQTTLTIPAPPAGQYIYVCSLGFNYTQTNSTGTVESNAVTTSSNFGGFALKFSAAAAINTIYEKTFNWGSPAGGGCARSTSPGTATTFVSPSAATNGQFTWQASYFNAP
jgi:hypothetical protein